KIDEQTLEIQLEAPDAVLPDKFIGLPMMSRAWSQAHKVEIAQDFNGKQETFAVRNANGTGPYMLDRYEPDIRTVLKKNPRWWGWSEKRSGNVDEIVLLSLPSAPSARPRRAKRVMVRVGGGGAPARAARPSPPRVPIVSARPWGHPPALRPG